MVILPHSGGDTFSAEKIQKQKRYFFDHFAKTKQTTGGKSDTNEYQGYHRLLYYPDAQLPKYVEISGGRLLNH